MPEKAEGKPTKKAAGRPRKRAVKRVDPRLQYYKPVRGRKDVVLLDALSEGNVDDTLRNAAKEMESDSILYISDSMRKPEVLGPNVRRVLRVNLMRWLDRCGLRMRKCKEEGMRIYAVAEVNSEGQGE